MVPATPSRMGEVISPLLEVGVGQMAMSPAPTSTGSLLVVVLNVQGGLLVVVVVPSDAVAYHS